MNPSFASIAAAKLACLPIGCLDSERETIVQEAIDAALAQEGIHSSHFGLPYHCLNGEESCGTYGSFGIRITVAHKDMPNLDPRCRDLDNESAEEKAIHHAGYEAVALVKKAVMTCIVAKNPDAQARRIAERAELVALFPAGSYVEEIPNGYCSDWCHKHLPWFKVTTPVGRFTIGWRKRVIHLEWTETQGTKTAANLFAADDVTKGERYIHAWGLDKARAYIAAVIASAA